MALKTKKRNSILIDKVVQIVPIPRNNNPSIKTDRGLVDISESTMLTGSSKSVRVPLDIRSGRLVDPLTREEREFLEEELQEDLNINKKEDNFWLRKNTAIKLSKTSRDLNSATIELNLGNAYDFILYKIALVSPRIANSWAERNNSPEYEFVIKDLDSEFIASKDFISKQDFVISYLMKNKNNKSKLRGLLRVYGGTERIPRGVSKDSATEFIYTELRKLADKAKSMNVLYDILNLSESAYEMKVFVEDAVAAGEIEKIGSTYKLLGGDVIGYSIDECAAYFSNKSNQDIKLRIKNKISTE